MSLSGAIPNGFDSQQICYEIPAILLGVNWEGGWPSPGCIAAFGCEAHGSVRLISPIGFK